MLEDKPLKYRELRKLLKRHNIYEIKHRGKGSHRLFVGIVEGCKVSVPIACHSEGQEFHPYIIRRIRDTFKIPIEEFYKK